MVTSKSTTPQNEPHLKTKHKKKSLREMEEGALTHTVEKM
jgi:hypothetical protein